MVVGGYPVVVGGGVLINCLVFTYQNFGTTNPKNPRGSPGVWRIQTWRYPWGLRVPAMRTWRTEHGKHILLLVETTTSATF